MIDIKAAADLAKRAINHVVIAIANCLPSVDVGKSCYLYETLLIHTHALFNSICQNINRELHVITKPDTAIFCDPESWPSPISILSRAEIETLRGQGARGRGASRTQLSGLYAREKYDSRAQRFSSAIALSAHANSTAEMAWGGEE